ncbi:MAG: carbohydrate kinase family protein [Patescibacteria group bacterium]
MAAKKFDFITIGGATRDITFYDDRGEFIATPQDLTRQKILGFEYGAKINIEKTYTTFGGGAANAAVNLANLGFKVAAAVAVGNDDNGRAIITHFKKRKVVTDLVEINPNLATGFSFLLTAGRENEHIAFLYRGANNSLNLSVKSLAAIRTARWLYVTSLSGHNWSAVLDKVCQHCHQLAWNPGGTQLHGGYPKLKKYLAKTTVLILNKDEAVELVLSSKQVNKKQINNVKYLLKQIKSWGVNIILITSGRRGADSYDGQKFYHIDPYNLRKKVFDTTGVGDCFGSTFVAGLERTGGNIGLALKASARNAAAVTEKIGAQNGFKKVI